MNNYEQLPIHNLGRRDVDEIEACMDCEGSGVLIIPAYSSGGEIVEEREHACACMLEITD